MNVSPHSHFLFQRVKSFLLPSEFRPQTIPIFQFGIDKLCTAHLFVVFSSFSSFRSILFPDQNFFFLLLSLSNSKCGLQRMNFSKEFISPLRLGNCQDWEKHFLCPFCSVHWPRGKSFPSSPPAPDCVSLFARTICIRRRRFYFFLPVPPRVRSEPNNGNIVVKKDSEVTLECEASGNPVPKVTWTRDVSTYVTLNRSFHVSFHHVTDSFTRYKNFRRRFRISPIVSIPLFFRVDSKSLNYSDVVDAFRCHFRLTDTSLWSPFY